MEFEIHTFCRRGVSCRGRVVGISSTVSLLNKRNKGLPPVPSSALLRPLRKPRLWTINPTASEIGHQMLQYFIYNVCGVDRNMWITSGVRNQNEPMVAAKFWIVWITFIVLLKVKHLQCHSTSQISQPPIVLSCKTETSHELHLIKGKIPEWRPQYKMIIFSLKFLNTYLFSLRSYHGVTR
jgi:hypothetical protein